MSTTTVAPSYTTLLVSTCAAHPGNSCIEIVLNTDPADDQLVFSFVTFRHPSEPAQIGVIDDLLLECEAHRPPSGFVMVDNHTAHFLYRGDPGSDVLFDASSRLKERIELRISESNGTHRRDSQTRLVHRR